jgi:hypothetical protein
MRNKDHIPVIHIDPEKLTNGEFDATLIPKYDQFFRRIVEYVLDITEGGREDTLLILIGEDGVEYEMNLPQSGFKKSLEKARQYFERIEEYETCDLINQSIKML